MRFALQNITIGRFTPELSRASTCSMPFSADLTSIVLILSLRNANGTAISRTLFMPNAATMSSLTRGLALAVIANSAMSPNLRKDSVNDRYAGRKLLPHVEMQCASSITRSPGWCELRHLINL
jgi:hypothetical protein